MEGPTSSWGLRNRITLLTLQEHDDDEVCISHMTNLRLNMQLTLWTESFLRSLQFLGYSTNSPHLMEPETRREKLQGVWWQWYRIFSVLLRLQSGRSRSWGSITGKSNKSISSPQQPGRHWDSLSLLSDRYRGAVTPWQGDRSDTDHSIAPRSRLNMRAASMPRCLVKNEGNFTLKASMFHT